MHACAPESCICIAIIYSADSIILCSIDLSIPS